MEPSPETDLQELVARRAALRERMHEQRATTPEDHDAFFRTVDQLLAVANRIVDIVSAPPEPPADPDAAPDSAAPSADAETAGAAPPTDPAPHS